MTVGECSAILVKVSPPARCSCQAAQQPVVAINAVHGVIHLLLPCSPVRPLCPLSFPSPFLLPVVLAEGMSGMTPSDPLSWRRLSYK
eukprot:360774-Chlamydomonas_euryale.AAC.18